MKPLRRSLPPVLAAFALCAAALCAFAVPASAQDGEVSRVIAIQVYAQGHDEDESTLYGVAPENEPVEVYQGQRVRLTLVGTGLIDGTGEEVEVPASFSVAGGQIDIIGRGENWVDVFVRRNSGGGQLNYRVGNDYQMRNEIRSGRIILRVVEEEEEE